MKSAQGKYSVGQEKHRELEHSNKVGTLHNPFCPLLPSSTPRAHSSPSLKSESSTTSSIATSVKTNTDSELEIEVLNLAPLMSRSAEHKRPDSPLPYPLPMPAYGGFFAPLSELLPEGNLPNPPYQR